MKKASKQAEAKAAQGYEKKPVWPVCGNCEHFASEQRAFGGGGGYVEEVNLHCSVGGFKTGKSATCKRHQPRKANP